jgi:RNA polymerase sigma factor (sigma-70 family)
MNPSTTRTRRAKRLQDLDRLELDRVASDFVVKYGAMMLKDAIRYSVNRSDAEDAYQRSLEILLTKAPTTDPAQLVPWLRVVVRNEALAIARSRHNQTLELTPERAESTWSEDAPPEVATESAADLQMGAEAMRHLSDDQVRCLIAHSEGLTYDEISSLTGFTRRKVTRCLENGRIAFARKVDAIAAGSECERMQPLIHRLLDADAEAAIELRPHLRHCLSCRTRLREYDAASRNIAALFPPAVVVVGYPTPGLLERVAEWWHGVGDRVAMHLLGADRWVEASGVKKAGLIAAIATTTAGGGVAVHSSIEHDTHRRAAVSVARPRAEAPASQLGLVDPVRLAADDREAARKDRAPEKSAGAERHPAPHPRNERTTTRPFAAQTGGLDDGSAEFLPEGQATP